MDRNWSQEGRKSQWITLRENTVEERRLWRGLTRFFERLGRGDSGEETCQSNRLETCQ
jgi:hypothetical protein